LRRSTTNSPIAPASATKSLPDQKECQMLKRTPELPQASHFPESATSYPALYLNSAWRVILCRDGIQWILQRRNVPAGTGDNRPERHSTDDWRGRSYCRTRSALIRCCDRFCGEIDPAAAAELRTLPDLAEPPSATSPEAKSPDLPRQSQPKPRLLSAPARISLFPIGNGTRSAP
jgi:hypothetical protein